VNQLVVLETLQATRDPDIFALGDCSAFPRREGRLPGRLRRRRAHQQASHLARTIEGRLRESRRVRSATAISARWCPSANTAPSDR
jgi:NADH dehydrogenase FAD-containing subunit